MWIEPDGTASGASSGAITLSGSRVTVTGKSSVRDWLAAQPTPFRCSYRHWKTWLALTPCSRATRAIDAPGASVASTIRRFSAAVRYTRFARPPSTPTSIASPTNKSSATLTLMSIRPDPDAYLLLDNAFRRSEISRESGYPRIQWATSRARLKCRAGNCPMDGEIVRAHRAKIRT